MLNRQPNGLAPKSNIINWAKDWFSAITIGELGQKTFK